ncbi:hypothetical protein [Alicyclobacillus ferrooxydans]|uniref:Uncharacterized protein n=1 Tax=Alicyclobacillus ferrooxydans TaxID=471514 RepID=A0A0P9CRX7_9BACL|nr:hypothetical protein [Alicyclobacillus ferrooxydans]KPV42300.1 hypothetical protein AN477_18540 [Alicyclobacillus ferrooxydans]
MKKSMVITVSISAVVSVATILLNAFTHDSRWIFADIIVGFIFLLAAGIGLGPNAGDGGGSIFIRRTFQEMYQNQPGKIKKLNQKSIRTSIYCLCIGLPNFILPIIAAVTYHYY